MANAIYPKWKAALLQNSADSDLDGTGATGVWAALYAAALKDFPYAAVSPRSVRVELAR